MTKSNQIVDSLMSHRSYRNYSDQAVSDADLEQIIACAHRAPTSVNGQHISVIVVRDQEKRSLIAELAGKQPWIAKAPVFICVVIDFAKTNIVLERRGVTQLIHESVEGFAVGCVDAGIAVAAVMTAARSLGLGAVAIGGIRANPGEMIELLGLPELTFPVVGCCIGHYASEPKLKPRLPIATFRHDEAWHGVPDDERVLSYDVELKEYWRSIGRQDGLSWSESITQRYERIYHPKTCTVALQQGFLFNK